MGGGFVGGGFVGGGLVGGAIVGAGVGGVVAAVVVSGGDVMAGTVIVVALTTIDVGSVVATAVPAGVVAEATDFASSSGGEIAVAIPPTSISAPNGVAILAHSGQRLDGALAVRGSSGGGNSLIVLTIRHDG